MVKCCNMNSVQVKNNTCFSTFINQNYIRNASNFNGANGTISNNIMHSVLFVDGGRVSYNLFLSQSLYDHSHYALYACVRSDHCTVNNNIMTPIRQSVSAYYVADCKEYYLVSGSDNTVTNNLTKKDNIGDNCINLNDIDWNVVFKDYNNGAISPNSNYHFQESYIQYENEYGVYADGVDFDKQIAPVPYIVAKRIDEQTDASGHLGIKVRVKAGE